jgi:hypothetical protein
MKKAVSGKESKMTEQLLVANGSAGQWDIAVDESVDGKEWSLEINGARTYLTFAIPDLQTIKQALQFLEAGPRPGGKQETTIGRFDGVAVALVWDNESSPRCFLRIGPKARSTLFINLQDEDLPTFIDALRQVVSDLPE